MKRSTDRILTTHAGRLPSPPDVMETVRAIQRGESHEREAFGRRVRAMTAEVVRQQGETGVDVVSDGEIGRIGPFWGRLAGYGPRALRPGEDPRQAGTPRGEWQLFPIFYEEYWKAQPMGAANLPLVCTGPISYRGHDAIQADIANFKAALAGANVEEAFMCSVSPGWLVPGFGYRDADFQPHYPSEEAFFFALAEAMRQEYRTIVEAGFILQIDDPRVVSGWDVPDPRNPDIVYGSGLGGTISRYDARTSQVRNVSPAAESTYGRRPVPGKYRWAWVFPIALSPKVKCARLCRQPASAGLSSMSSMSAANVTSMQCSQT